VTEMPTHVTAWARDVAALFRRHKARDPFSVSFHGRVIEPEEQLVEYVIAALARGGCPATAAVLEEVDRLRAGMRETT
jgi:hypothetical protein